MSDPVDDKTLEDYLHRKSALSMGYRRVYVEEAPPPELDRAITTRARRAMRWLIPGIASVVIGCAIVLGVQLSVNMWMNAMVNAEKNIKRIREEEKAEAERKRLEQPVAVVIDAGNIAKQVEMDAAEKQRVDEATRKAWLAYIETLKRDGKHAEADKELEKLKVMFPQAAKPQ